MAPTRIAAVSDTHLPRFGRALPAALIRGISDAEPALILHAGDWTDELALRLLEELGPVVGVAGNNDGPALHERFGTHRIVALEDARVGLTHGHLGRGTTTLERARTAFADEPPGSLAAIVFGHSHIPLVRAPLVAGEPWLVNPGSPTDRRRQAAYSWALLTLEGGTVVDAELRTFTDRATG